MYQGQYPEYFMIKKDMIGDCLLNGDNLLEIQIHNYNNTSSDMSSITFFSVGLSDSSSYYSPVPGWFDPPEPFTSSDLPIVVINRQIIQHKQTSPGTPIETPAGSCQGSTSIPLR